MKKWQITLATVIICCVFLWIGFYAWYAVKSLTTPTQENKSDFNKESQCSNMYSTVKDKLTEEYTLWEDEENNWRLWNVEIRYSPVLDSCMAEYHWWENTYLYTDNWEPHYNPIKIYELADINNWYTILANCEATADNLHWCDDTFKSKVAKYK
jgi:hypothetical protein